MDFEHGKLVLEQRSPCKADKPRDASYRNEDNNVPPRGHTTPCTAAKKSLCGLARYRTGAKVDSQRKSQNRRTGIAVACFSDG